MDGSRQKKIASGFLVRFIFRRGRRQWRRILECISTEGGCIPVECNLKGIGEKIIFGGGTWGIIILCKMEA